MGPCVWPGDAISAPLCLGAPLCLLVVVSWGPAAPPPKGCALSCHSALQHLPTFRMCFFPYDAPFVVIPLNPAHLAPFGPSLKPFSSLLAARWPAAWTARSTLLEAIGSLCPKPHTRRAALLRARRSAATSRPASSNPPPPGPALLTTPPIISARIRALTAAAA